ncbi:MAG TPA: choice-of-anchor J domain-containing protein [Pyrinomonadaceae bacterium]
MKSVARAALIVLVFLLAGGSAAAQIENFEDITQLPARGWVMQNNSVPPGTTGWFQGNSTFPAHTGASNSYIAADFHNANDTGVINNWLLTPPISLSTGAMVTFWTRARAGTMFPDRLEVRLSTNGASSNVGTSANEVGDFTTRLLVINPNLEVGGYPQNWTQYQVFVPGTPGTGRLAFRYFVTNGGPSGDNSDYIGIDTFSVNTGDPPPPGDTPLDYNGDGRTDYVVVRKTGSGSPGQVTWFINNGTNYTQTPWGTSTDYYISGDYDGDDKADVTVYRPETENSYFYTLRSSNGTFIARQLGTNSDDPTVVGDYDGDDIDDFAVYRGGAAQGQKSFWYYFGSATPNAVLSSVEWGQNGDYPVPGDFDGDGKNDFCIQRNNGNNEGVFYLNKSGGGFETVFWGTSSDYILPGDYDGDGKTDFAVVRGSGGQILWSVLGRNNNNIIHFGAAWGSTQTDFPTHGDYDGDGKTDLAVWRPGITPGSPPAYFYVRKSTNGALSAVQWGQLGDYPVANFNGH